MTKNENEKSNKTESNSQKILKSSEIKSALTDYSEIVVDKLLDVDNEIFQKIPIIKTLLALVAYSKDVNERFFLKKVKRFIEGFDDTNQYIRDRIEAALPSQQDKEDMAEGLLIYLQRFEQISKAEILCKLFLSRCYKVISQEEFERLLFALDRIDVNDIATLREFYTDDNAYKHLNDPKGFKWNETIQWNEHRIVLRSFINVKLIAVDYSGAPKTGQIYPRNDGGSEAFDKTSLGKQFIKILDFTPEQK